MANVNIVELGRSFTDHDFYMLRDYEVRREGVTVYTVAKTRGAPWVVGNGPVCIEDIRDATPYNHNRAFGGWYDATRGEYIWDKLARFTNRDSAERYARYRGETCIFNLDTGEEVYL